LNPAKCGAIDVTIWQKKLGMVERVKEFGTKLQIDSFLDEGVFQQRDVPIIQTGPGKEAAPRRSERAQVFHTEQRGMKYGFPERGSLMFSEPDVKFGVSTGSEIAPALLVPSKELSSVSVRVTEKTGGEPGDAAQRQPFTNLLGHQGGRRAVGSHS